MTMTWLSSKEEKAALDANSDNESISNQSTSSSFTRNDILICATNGKVYAVHKRTGARIWRADFPTGSKSRWSVGSMGGIVSVFITDQDRLVIASSGKAACLNLLTGEELWVNKMKGCGYEEVGVLCTPSHALKPQHAAPAPPLGENNDDDDDAPPGYHETEHSLTEKSVVVLCTSGKCLGIDAETGEELWRFNCPKGGYKIPSALVDPEGGSTTVYIGCGTRLYCLNAISGELKWDVKITNAKMSLGYMTLATPWSSRLAAEAYTAFSQFPLAQQQNEARTRGAAAGAGAAAAGAAGG